MPAKRKAPEGDGAKRRTGRRRTANRKTVLVVDVEVLRRRSEELLAVLARRAYEIFERRGGAPGSHDGDWLQAEAELLHPVPVEVASARHHVIVRAEVPGFGPGEIQIALEPRRVTVAGRRQLGAAGDVEPVLHTAPFAPTFCRGIELPEDVEPDSVSSVLTDGVLELTLQKAGAPE